MIRIYVMVKPNAKEERVEQVGEREYRISVKKPPVQGKANAAIVDALADHFKVSKSEVNIVGGYFAKKKIVEIGWK